MSRPPGAPDGPRRSLRELLGRPTPGIVTTQAEPQGNLILIDNELAMILVEGDADPLRGETLAAATERTVGTLRLVISETREVRDRTRLLRSALYALLGTLVLVSIVAIVLWVRRLMLRRLTLLAERAAAATHVGGTQVLTADRLLPIVRRAVSAVTTGLVAVAVYEWLSYVLAQFPYTRPWGEQLLGFFEGAGLQLGQGC